MSASTVSTASAIKSTIPNTNTAANTNTATTATATTAPPQSQSSSPSPSPAFALYRASSLGQSFYSALKQLESCGELTATQLTTALHIFDQSINNRLITELSNKVLITGQLHTYRHCDSVWTLVVQAPRISSNTGILEPRSLKIVACEAKNKRRRGN